MSFVIIDKQNDVSREQLKPVSLRQQTAKAVMCSALDPMWNLHHDS